MITQPLTSYGLPSQGGRLSTDRKPKVLVVDDEDSNLRLFDAQLSPLGYEIAFARNGDEAIAKARQVDPDVILLDIMMPQRNGFEVAAELKNCEETKTIPIVVITSLNDVASRIKALEAGVDDFLTKPVDKFELRARVQSLVKVKAYYDYMRNYQKRLEAEVAKQTEALRAAYLDTIYRLSRAAEYRDEDTGAHILRMSHYAAAIARQMGLSEEQAQTLLYAAPMHDIGKIGVPDHILLKRGELTRDEWEAMKMHTVIGGRILENADSELLQLAEVIALTHHERWDGTGYPRGLEGEEIPIESRIAAVADVFDALTSPRPYKAALSVERAHKIIRAGRGGHFDPKVVDAFFAIEDEILDIMERYKD